MTTYGQRRAAALAAGAQEGAAVNRHRHWEAIAYCLCNPNAMWQNYYLQLQWRDKPGLVWC